MTEKQKQWTIIVAATVIGLAVTVYKVYTAIIPALAEYIAEQIPESVYQEIGESSLKQLDLNEFSQSQLPEATRNELVGEFKTTLRELKIDEAAYTLYFRSWRKKPNAFALMNGSIIITDELVNLLKNNDEVIAVLLHEIGHIEYNHAMENMIRASIFYLGSTFIVGDVTLVSNFLIESASTSVYNAYSRDFELEADHFAMNSLTQINGDHKVIKSALIKIYESSESQEFHWLSTHPTLNKRLASLEL